MHYLLSHVTLWCHVITHARRVSVIGRPVRREGGAEDGMGTMLMRNESQVLRGQPRSRRRSELNIWILPGRPTIHLENWLRLRVDIELMMIPNSP